MDASLSSVYQIVQSIRWIFYEVAGKVVEHARKLYLKINVEIKKFILYCEFRRRCAKLSD